MALNVPCLGCNNRSVRCHSSCTAYAEYKAQLQECNKDLYQWDPADSYLQEQIYKSMSYRIRRYDQRNKHHYR